MGCEAQQFKQLRHKMEMLKLAKIGTSRRLDTFNNSIKQLDILHQPEKVRRERSGFGNKQK